MEGVFASLYLIHVVRTLASYIVFIFYGSHILKFLALKDCSTWEDDPMPWTYKCLSL